MLPMLTPMMNDLQQPQMDGFGAYADLAIEITK